MPAFQHSTNRNSIALSDVDLQISMSQRHPQHVSDRDDNEAPAHNENLPPTHVASDIWLNAPTEAKTRQTHYKPFATDAPVLFLFLIFTLAFIGGIEGVLRKGVPIQVESTLKKFNSTQHLLDTSTLAGSGLVNKMVSFGNNYILKQEAAGLMSCIGIEMIVSATEIKQCDTATPTSCITAATEYTYEKPIFNKPISTMPCYICAMETESIEIRGWITATTTHCPNCSVTSPATVYPCATCEGTVLTALPLWEATPTVAAKSHVTNAPKIHEHQMTKERAQR